MDGGEAQIPPGGNGGWQAEVAFIRRVLIALALVALSLLFWQVRDALLLAFAGVLVAVLLTALAQPLQMRLGLSHIWALVAVALGLGVLVTLVAFLVGGQLQAQVAGLSDQLPQAVEALESRFGVTLPAPGGGGDAGTSLDPAMLGSVAGRLAGIGSAVVGALSALVIAVVGGFYLAADPALYRRGLGKLLPKSQNMRAEDALLASGEALKLWLGAQFISMLIVGLLAGLGTWALGLPSPLALGLVAGLAGFVPLLGSIAGAVPPLLLALSNGGPMLVLWTALLFVAVQQVESNMITPLVEKRLVSLPPALLLFAVVAVGLLFGLPGVVLAAPITVVAFVLVKKLYVRQVLGKRTEVPGEDG